MQNPRSSLARNAGTGPERGSGRLPTGSTVATRDQPQKMPLITALPGPVLRMLKVTLPVRLQTR